MGMMSAVTQLTYQNRLLGREIRKVKKTKSVKTQVVVTQPVQAEKQPDEKKDEDKPNSKLRLNKLPKDEKTYSKERSFPTAKGWADS